MTRLLYQIFYKEQRVRDRQNISVIRHSSFVIHHFLEEKDTQYGSLEHSIQLYDHE